MTTIIIDVIVGMSDFKDKVIQLETTDNQTVIRRLVTYYLERIESAEFATVYYCGKRLFDVFI